MHVRSQIVAAAALGGAFALISCSNPESFTEPTRQSERFGDLTNYELNGQQSLVFHVNVLPEPQIVHPHFEGHWTFSDPEKPVDFYVIPSAYYNPDASPTAQDTIYWSSVQNAVVGQQRAPSMHLHPKPGDWVIVLYNGLPFGPTTRAKFSTELDLTYFK